MEHEQEILDVVRKSLPQYVSETLRERLDLADRAEELDQEVDSLNSQLEKVRADLNTEKASHRHLKQQHDTVCERHDEVEQRSRDMDMTMLQLRLELAETRVQDYRDTMAALLRPSTVRTQIQKHIATEGGDTPTGYCHQDGTQQLQRNPGFATPVTETEERTEE